MLEIAQDFTISFFLGNPLFKKKNFLMLKKTHTNSNT